MTVHRNYESTGIRDPQGFAKAKNVTLDLDNILYRSVKWPDSRPGMSGRIYDTYVIKLAEIRVKHWISKKWNIYCGFVVL